MRFRYNVIMLLSATFFLAACKKETKVPAYNEEPVISAYLFAGNCVSIKITAQIAVSTETSSAGEGIDTLHVYVDDDSGSHLLMNMGDGVYADTTLMIGEGKQYSLHFVYKEKMISGTTLVPSAPQNFTQSVDELSVSKIEEGTMPTPGSFQMNDPISLNWSNDDQSYYMIIVENMESSPELIRDTTSTRFRITSFRNEPAVTDQYQLRDQQFQYFGTHRLVLYHLNPDYAALYSGNSNSSQSLSNPTTNITNGVGIFTGISTDTLFLKVNKQQ